MYWLRAWKRRGHTLGVSSRCCYPLWKRWNDGVSSQGRGPLGSLGWSCFPLWNRWNDGSWPEELSSAVEHAADHAIQYRRLQGRALAESDDDLMVVSDTEWIRCDINNRRKAVKLSQEEASEDGAADGEAADTFSLIIDQGLDM